MHIKRDIGDFPQLRNEGDAQCEIRHEMPIHHINVDEIRTTTFKHADITLKIHEVRRQNRGGDFDVTEHGNPFP